MLDVGSDLRILVQIVALLSVIILCICVSYQLLFPNIITCPWTKPSPEVQKKEKEYTVIFAGSFNPPHNGHLSMIKYLAHRYGEVVLVIGINPSKKYDVNPNDRAQILRKMVEAIEGGNIRVQVVSDYIWRYASQINAKILFRGIRTWETDGKAELFLLLQNILGPMVLGLKYPLPTIFMQGKTEFNHISSSLIREICKTAKIKQGSGPSPILDDLVPGTVNNVISSMYYN